MKRRAPWVIALLLGATAAFGPLGACNRQKGPSSEELRRAVLSALADREARLSRYHFAARTEAPGQPVVNYDFAYRAPGRMRGRLFRPEEQTLSFDGQNVYELLPAKHVFRKLVLPEKADERALKVSERFVPFVPEGFRTPLLPWKSVTVSAVTHPRAPEAVAIKAQLSDSTGQPLIVTYTLRWPSGDFLVKRIEGSGGVGELRLEEEQCESRLRICLPLRYSQYKDGERVGGTQVTELEIFEAPSQEEFTLAPPAGFTVEDGTL